MDFESVIKEYYKKLYAHKLNNPDEMDHFLERKSKRIYTTTPGTNKQLHQGCKVQSQYAKFSFYVQAMNKWNFKLKTHTISLVPPQMKYLVINLTKYMCTNLYEKTTKL